MAWTAASTKERRRVPKRRVWNRCTRSRPSGPPADRDIAELFSGDYRLSMLRAMTEARGIRVRGVDYESYIQATSAGWRCCGELASSSGSTPIIGGYPMISRRAPRVTTPSAGADGHPASIHHRSRSADRRGWRDLIRQGAGFSQSHAARPGRDRADVSWALARRKELLVEQGHA